jgi:hypothetical protein
MSLDNEHARRQQLDILKRISDQPQTFYRPISGGNTDRVFGVGGGFTGLKREVRNALIQGWQKADLRSAQLAINAMLWDVPEIKTFLQKRHRSIWEELYEHFKLNNKEATRAKPALKTALYAACYGMGVRKIGSNLTEALADVGIVRNGNLFTKHPLIKALLNGRKRAVAAIQRNGGAKTCFGKWLSDFELTTPQILAQISQAIELKIMHAIFEVAAKTSNFTITLFQHDGIAVHFTDKSKAERWKRRMTKAVSEEAQRLEASKPKKSRAVRGPSRTVTAPKSVRPKTVKPQVAKPQASKTLATAPQSVMKQKSPQMTQVSRPQTQLQPRTQQPISPRTATVQPTTPTNYAPLRTI